jgi:WD40 repeat protein
VVLPEKLYYLATLPLPFSSLSNDFSDVYAACLALTTVAGTATAPCPKLASIYADHSLFVWDISDIQNVVKYRSFVYHRACVWDVQFISTADSPIFGAGTFATCSADNSIRIWNTDPKAQRLSRWRSVYSREMLHVIEIDDPLATSTVTVTATAAGVIGGAGAEVDVSGAYVRQSSSSTASTIPAGLNTSVASSSAADVAIGSARPPTDICRGIPDTELPDRPQGAAAPRALAVHPAGTQLVCGDRAGLLRVFDLASMAQVVSTHAHSAEVLTLSFSPPMRPTGEGDGSWTIDYDEEDEEEEEDEVVAEGGQSRALRKSTSRGGRGGRNPLVLLASAGRDRLVHILDASNGYRPVTTLDNHSSSVTIVKFTSDGRRLLR